MGATVREEMVNAVWAYAQATGAWQFATSFTAGWRSRRWFQRSEKVMLGEGTRAFVGGDPLSKLISCLPHCSLASQLLRLPWMRVAGGFLSPAASGLDRGDGHPAQQLLGFQSEVFFFSGRQPFPTARNSWWHAFVPEGWQFQARPSRIRAVPQNAWIHVADGFCLKPLALMCEEQKGSSSGLIGLAFPAVWTKDPI